jgi:hypothetical protein
MNFEAFYDELASSRRNDDLRILIEKRVYSYFATLSLPQRPTIYDYLVLSLRQKDAIATFNWDPFLLQALLRNEVITRTRGPVPIFLHGNVMVGFCDKDSVLGIMGARCSHCGEPLGRSKLLYPVRHKDYTRDRFVKSQWDDLRRYLRTTYYLTIFGYSAPRTDVEAKGLMIDVWKANPTFQLAEVDIVDIKPADKLLENWKEFRCSHHYNITNSVFRSSLFLQPRRSCESLASASLMLRVWKDNPFPRFETIEELQEWLKPLIEEEERYDRERKDFSGKPLPPNA